MGRNCRQHTVDEVIYPVVNRILSVGFNVIAGGREIKYMRTVGLISNRVTQVIILPAAVTQAGGCGLGNCLVICHRGSPRKQDLSRQ